MKNYRDLGVTMPTLTNRGSRMEEAGLSGPSSTCIADQYQGLVLEFTNILVFIVVRVWQKCFKHFLQSFKSSISFIFRC
jgi:hypothetical protein